jgi:hypothetical protein
MMSWEMTEKLAWFCVLNATEPSVNGTLTGDGNASGQRLAIKITSPPIVDR